MAFLETHVFSQALEVAVTVNVLLPEPSQGIGLEGAKAQEPPRVMYLLHGDTATTSPSGCGAPPWSAIAPSITWR